MKSGDVVIVRPPAEILATLDEQGNLDGLPFMPEMLGYLGRRVTVTARLTRPCDTIGYHGVRKISNAVLLDDLRCDGSGHGGCGAQCRLYWKESWLRPAGTDECDLVIPRDDDYERLAQVARANILATPDDDRSPEDDVEPRYRCQATEFLSASKYVAWWSPASLLGELTEGNVGILRFTGVLARMVYFETVRRLGIVQHSPFKPTGRTPEKYPLSGELKIGDRVRVRSRAEISRTIDAKGGGTRGLWFDREQLRFCGKEARVEAKVTRFIDEKTGKVVNLSSDCWILEGMVCSGVRSQCRWFCSRGVAAWWRETWLERVDDAADATVDSGPIRD